MSQLIINTEDLDEVATHLQQGCILSDQKGIPAMMLVGILCQIIDDIQDRLREQHKPRIVVPGSGRPN